MNPSHEKNQISKRIRRLERRLDESVKCQESKDFMKDKGTPPSYYRKALTTAESRYEQFN